jgi:hypothetical protein
MLNFIDDLRMRGFLQARCIYYTYILLDVDFTHVIATIWCGLVAALAICY